MKDNAPEPGSGATTARDERFSGREHASHEQRSAQHEAGLYRNGLRLNEHIVFAKAGCTLSSATFTWLIMCR